jgi:hypothetical protein
MAVLGREFILCIHDITPAAMPSVRAMMEAMGPYVGHHIALAVVPAPWRDIPISAARESADSLARLSGEILLHGCTHSRPPSFSPLSTMIGQSDEFVGLHPIEADRRIVEGQSILQRVFGAPASGFVPPGWRRATIQPEMLVAACVEYILDFHSINRFGLFRYPLATWSWDCGRIGLAGYLGELCGSITSRLRDSVCCITLHPRDLERGFLPRAVALADRLVESGYQPVLPCEIIRRVTENSHEETTGLSADTTS